MFIVMLVGFVVYVNSVVEVFIYVVFIACICYYVVWWFYIVGGCLYLAVRVGLFVVVGMLVAWLDGAGCGLVFWWCFSWFVATLFAWHCWLRFAPCLLWFLVCAWFVVLRWSFSCIV